MFFGQRKYSLTAFAMACGGKIRKRFLCYFQLQVFQIKTEIPGDRSHCYGVLTTPYLSRRFIPFVANTYVSSG